MMPGREAAKATDHQQASIREAANINNAANKDSGRTATQKQPKRENSSQRPVS